MEAFKEHKKGEPFKDWDSSEHMEIRYKEEVVFEGEAMWFLDRPT